VLDLDIGTDVLPALALGAEQPPAHVLDRAPSRGHLLDRHLFARAFGIFCPVEATLELTAFLVALYAAGWRLGEAFPAGSAVLIASRAAFTAVVFGQVANAFACRSTTPPPWRWLPPQRCWRPT
jgi:magnesium-transporting ATPase (P-type)